MSASSAFPLLAEVGPQRPASADVPSASAIYELAGGNDIKDDLEGCTTLADMWTRSVERYPDNNCLGTREKGEPFTYLSYKEVRRLRVVAPGLGRAGFVPQRTAISAATLSTAQLAIQYR